MNFYLRVNKIKPCASESLVFMVGWTSGLFETLHITYKYESSSQRSENTFTARCLAEKYFWNLIRTKDTTTVLFAGAETAKFKNAPGL